MNRELSIKLIKRAIGSILPRSAEIDLGILSDGRIIVLEEEKEEGRTLAGNFACVCTSARALA